MPSTNESVKAPIGVRGCQGLLFGVVIALAAHLSLGTEMAVAGEPGKRGSVIVTADMRENAMRNIERHAWAERKRERLERQVAPFMELSLEALWLLLPSQEMGRDARGYHHAHGCPRCLLEHEGEELGRGRWNINLLERPWQVQCRRCREWFPKNDFASYYQSALDEQGKFRLGAGDPQYLQPKAGVEGKARDWVDDGTGFGVQSDWTWAEDAQRWARGRDVAAEEFRWYFAGRYAFELWREVPAAALAMAKLYTMSEDPEYALRAAIILDRLAEIYPEMDERPHRARGMNTTYGPGRVMGDGWEYNHVYKPIARAYDYIYDEIRGNDQLVATLSDHAQRYGLREKDSFEAIDRNIREQVLKDMAAYIRDQGRAGPRGRTQMAMATVAIALDEPGLTEALLDWLFLPEGGNLEHTLVQNMNRDGLGSNVGLGYATSPARYVHQIAELIGGYEGYEGVDLYRDYRNFINAFWSYRHARVLNRTHFMIGDGGVSMSQSERTPPVELVLSGYRRFGTPELAHEVWRASGQDLDTIELDIYDPEPTGLLQNLKNDLDTDPPLVSFNSGGYGLAVMQPPYKEHERAAGVYYGRAMSPSHAHADRLSLHLIAHGEVMIPDLGNPLWKGRFPKRHGFTRHVVSHNTVMVNDTNMNPNYSGHTRLFADAGHVRVTDVDGVGRGRPARGDEPTRIYDDVDTYRRHVVMVDVDERDSYLLDLFWVRGGRSHRLIQNAGGYETTHSGLDFTRQDGGTYAGADVAYGEFYDYDGSRYRGYDGTGFMFLKDPKRAQPGEETFWIDWAIEPRYSHDPDWQAHLRVHNMTPVDEVALVTAEPSRGSPDQMRYMLRSRFGGPGPLRSQFVSVIEPYNPEPFIEQVRVLERLERPGLFAAAVEVQLKDGRRDVILVRERPGALAAGEVRLEGRLGVVRFEDDEPTRMTLIAGERLEAGDRSVTLDGGPPTGRLVGFDDADPLDVRLELSHELPPEAELEGKYILFDNGNRADASYRIEAVTGANEISIGRKPVYEQFVDPEDPAQGRVPNIVPGDRFLIPRSATWARD